MSGKLDWRNGWPGLAETRLEAAQEMREAMQEADASKSCGNGHLYYLLWACATGLLALLEDLPQDKQKEDTNHG